MQKIYVGLMKQDMQNIAQYAKRYPEYAKQYATKSARNM